MTPKPLDLHLDISNDQELDPASTLEIMPVMNDLLETLKPAISSDQGDFQQAQDNLVQWLIADWGVERLLAGFGLEPKIQKPATGLITKARISLFTNGYWLPMFPIDILDIDKEQYFPAVMASKLMIELVQEGQYPGLWKPCPQHLSNLIVKAITSPGDPGVSVAGHSTGFKFPTVLPESGVKVEGFVAAVNDYLAEEQAVRPVPVQLTAGIPGKLTIKFNPAVVTVVRQLHDNPDGKLSMSWQNQNDFEQAAAKAVAHVSLSSVANASLQELKFRLNTEFLAETLLFPPNQNVSNQAQLVTPLVSLAQGFHTDPKGAALTGLELMLQARTLDIKATLALHPDINGYPAPMPYSGAILSINWTKDSNPENADSCLVLSFPTPIQIPDARWWAVLSVQQGEVLWCLANNPPASTGLCLYRKYDEAWSNRGEHLWAQTRLRILAPKPENLTAITVQRGNIEVHLPVDGLVNADIETLNKLNTSDTAQLDISFFAAAIGTISLSDLRVVYK